MPRARPPDPTKQHPPAPGSRSRRVFSQPLDADASPEEAAARRRRGDQTGRHKCVCQPWPCTPASCSPCACARSRADRVGHCKTCGACKACGLAGRPFYTHQDLRYIETGQGPASYLRTLRKEAS